MSVTNSDANNGKDGSQIDGDLDKEEGRRMDMSSMCLIHTCCNGISPVSHPHWPEAPRRPHEESHAPTVVTDHATHGTDFSLHNSLSALVA